MSDDTEAGPCECGRPSERVCTNCWERFCVECCDNEYNLIIPGAMCVGCRKARWETANE